MKKKKSIKDIISYSEIKKGQLVGGILFVSLGMLLSICPILVIYKVIKSLFLYGKLEQSTIQFCTYGLAAVVLSYCLTYIGGILCHKFSYVLISNLKKKILFPQLIVPHVFDWLSVIMRRLTRNMLRILKVLKAFSLPRDRCRSFWEQV